MRKYSKMFFVMIMGTLMSQSLMAEVLHPIDYSFNPTAEKNPAQLLLSEKARKKFNMSKGAIRSAMKSSPDWENMDERLRSKLSKNMKNFYQIDWDYCSLYWDKDKGISVVSTVNQPSRIYFNRTRFNGPEDMAFELARTLPINEKTNRPYFDLTPELLVKLEEQTGTKLTPEQKDWLSAYASVLNENFHYFYGEPFFMFQDVMDEVDKSELIGRFYPNKLFLKAEQELFVPTVEQERNFLYLKLIETMSESKQDEVLKMLIGLPEDKEMRKVLLDDTERLLTEPGMKKYKKTVEKIVKELKKNNLDARKEKVLLNKLFPIMKKSRFKYDLFARYMQTTPDALGQIMPFVSEKHQGLVKQVKSDLDRIDEIYANKIKIGSVLGRPLYNYDRVMKNFSLMSSNCHGKGESRVTLPGNVQDTVLYSNATRGSLVLILNSRYTQLANVGVSFLQMTEDINTLAKEQGVDMTNPQNNRTAFKQAIYMLSSQAIDACNQVMDHKYTKEVIQYNVTDFGEERRMSEKIKLKPFNVRTITNHKTPMQCEIKEMER